MSNLNDFPLVITTSLYKNTDDLSIIDILIEISKYWEIDITTEQLAIFKNITLSSDLTPYFKKSVISFIDNL